MQVSNLIWFSQMIQFINLPNDMYTNTRLASDVISPIPFDASFCETFFVSFSFDLI